ncbi:MAG: stage VI sporulation protein F [Erysipelotrichaceae bacterium]|nr:stage VI sporulation protein F [Erysipelotrichaceae bacterium]
MAFSDNFFKKIEKKTNVDKDTILSLASKLQQGNMKDENTLKEVIQDISRITGREVSKEKEQKIIDTVLSNGVPKNLDKYLDDIEN